MEGLGQKRRQYVLALDESLRDIVEQLAGIPEVERVILFGSYADGRRDLFTDLDLLVVMASEQDFVTRTAKLYQGLRLGVDVDLLVYTPEELEFNKGKPFIRHILKAGEVIYEKKPVGRG